MSPDKLSEKRNEWAWIAQSKAQFGPARYSENWARKSSRQSKCAFCFSSGSRIVSPWYNYHAPLTSNPDKTPGIVVRFARQSIRDDWFSNRHKLSVANSDVRIQENLNMQRQQLLWEAKQWPREHDFHFVWHNGGKVLARWREGESVVIRSRSDLTA